MSSDPSPKPGSITWRDLTVPNAKQVAQFYKEVVGWNIEPVKMGDYDDFSANTPHDGQTVAGICHARGENANLPPQWLLYITVDNLDNSVAKCLELGGEVVDGPKALGDGRMCVVKDPAGAVSALLYSPVG